MKVSQEQVLQINSVRIWTAVQGNGIPMVLCHGGPGGYDYLSPIADTVPDLCQVVRYDQRGSGRSQLIGPYDVSTFVDDLEGLRKHFNFERWIVGGHSWGAGLALAYAVRFPAQTVAILHIAGTGIDPGWHDEYRENRLNALSESEREEYQHLRAQREQAEGPDEEQILDRLRALSNKTDVFDPNRVNDLPSFDEYPVSNEANEKVGADWKSYTTDSEFQQSVCNLSIPVLFLHGACDPRPSHFIETLAAKLSRGTFASIPESGHYPWIEKPDEVKTALRQFVVDFAIME
ncbi:MAG: alpha/beta hydrolase [Candidatus Poribacteria bacterium]|nr:alpha/beta hydrolase [Candidatus Poribacteria bacterium]